MNQITRHYDRLTANERFKLFLAAMSRDDGTEAAALGGTCPSFHYSMADWGYSSRVKASVQLMTLLSLELAPHLAIVRHLDGQADYIDACLEILEPCGIDAAIEAHWQAIDPEGTPDNREGMPKPDLKALAAGGAGMPYEVTRRLREFWEKLRARELEVLASILAAFDRFTREQWVMSGPEALSAHKELFAGNESYLREAQDLPVEDEAAKRVCAQFTEMWKLSLHQEQDA